jgi:hypothetical protein
MAIISFRLLAFDPSATAQQLVKQDFANFTGSDFLEYCPGDSTTPLQSTAEIDGALQSLVCIAYVNGCAAGLGYAVNSKFTANRTFTQVYDIIAKYIIGHPESRNRALRRLMLEALEASTKK